MKTLINNVTKGSVLGALCLTSVSALGQAYTAAEIDEMDKRFSLDVALNTDQFFGFYPTISGAYTVNESFDFTFYGILWAGGTGGAWGNWGEFGVGVAFSPLEGVTINPSVGFTGGNLLSSGTADKAIVGDGVVPNIFVNYDLNRIEAEFYAGYYAPLRERKAGGEQTTLSFLHFWFSAGYQFHPFVSVGGHYEQLQNTGGSSALSSTVYQWLGPYVQFSKPSGGFFARVTAGVDMARGGDSFWKIATGYSF